MSTLVPPLPTTLSTRAAVVPRRNPNIDALRGIAILMVVGHHLNFFSFWTRVGWAGVDLFFVLSGYLIAGLLFEEWHRSGSIDFGRFFVRRGFKIYPSFFALLLVSVAINFVRPGISSYPVTWQAFLAEICFAQSYVHGIWGQTWSLGVEEHFYVLLPLLFWLMYRRSRANADPFRWLPGLFVAIATIELVLRFETTWALSSVADELRYLCPTHLRIDGLLFGVVLSYYRHFQSATFLEIAQSSATFALTGAMVVILAMVPLNNPIMHTVGFTVLYFGFGFLLARVVDARPKKMVASLVAPLAQVGYYSYSIYLWHGWICRLLPHATVVGFAGCLAASIALGVLMAKLIEYPALALRDRSFPSMTSDAKYEATQLPTTMA